MPSSESADTAGTVVAGIVLDGFEALTVERCAAVARAADHFAHRDWSAMQQEVVARVDGYGLAVTTAVAEVEAALAPHRETVVSRKVWTAALRIYGEAVVLRPDVEIAQTFFNSVTRRLLTTVGVDREIEFLEPVTPLDLPLPLLRWQVDGDLGVVLTGAVEQAMPEDASSGWKNLGRDILLVVADCERRLRLHGVATGVSGLELLEAPFYRGQGAYLVGRIIVDDLSLPFAIAVHNTARGLTIGAVLIDVEDVSVLFSYTRAAFFVDAECPAALVAYLGALLPTRTCDELYTAIGHRKHGKTELFRDFWRHITTSEDVFDHARGIRGMVMIVFTAPGYGVVFKIIRDRFPYPKQTTRRQIMSKYRLVSRHDRAGRLVDAHEFEHLQFARSVFSSALLEELESDATRSVTIEDDHVTLHHVYVERRLVPLDIYLREANPVKARAAIIDYGRAIKNLAAANIFPGDMLLKNFGVTRGGRVVFYDYDEITSITGCNFREMPDTNRPDEEMAADPWFGVGDNDIFPEEFTRFLGIRGELRKAFDYHHGDLFGVRFWSRMQERLATGEVIEIFPYKRSRRLGAGIRRTAGPVE